MNETPKEKTQCKTCKRQYPIIYMRCPFCKQKNPLRQASAPKAPACICFEFAGDNPDCPVHGRHP